MRTKLTLSLLFAFGLITMLSAQTVTIIKKTREPNGGESSETIVKKGQAARDFDIDKYVAANKADNVSLNITSTGGDEDRQVTITGSNGPELEVSDRWDMVGREVRNSVADAVRWAEQQAEGVANGNWDANWNDCCNPHQGAFLGVDEDSDEDPDEPGVVVEISRNTAADRAGLRDNDKIMSFNEIPITRWKDLSTIINSSKVGDSLRIVYMRNGKEGKTVAILGSTNDLEWESEHKPKGFLGVSNIDNGDEGPGEMVKITKNSAADKAGLKDGDRIVMLDDTNIEDFEDISDFMAYTTPGQQIQVTYIHNGSRNSTGVTLGTEESWDWSNSWANAQSWDFNEKEKSACIGVYSTLTELTDGNYGAIITSFTDNSAAKDENMKDDDIILRINDDPVTEDEDLWDLIAKYEPNDEVLVTFQRSGRERTQRIKLRPCNNESSEITITNTVSDGTVQERQFMTWDWNDDDRQQLRERRTITIHKNSGSDAPVINASPNGNPRSESSAQTLQLTSFKAFPNPTSSEVTIEFTAAKQSTVVSLLDASGRQLFQEELNAFSGQYIQQFDLREYAKGIIVIRVQQGDKVFTEQVVVQ
jgi:S1-C subfamily serine protease